MADPLDNYESYGANEAHDVVRTVEVLVGTRRFRVEVQQNRASHLAPDPYTAVGYQEKEVVLSTAGEAESKAMTWVRVEGFPWIQQPDAGAALAQALDFLAERAR